jgi:acyl carrier protein
MTQNEAIAWFAEIFQEAPENISKETQREEIPAWDSLGILTLMAAFDEEFEILLTEEEVAGLQTVGDAMDILKKHGHLN